VTHSNAVYVDLILEGEKPGSLAVQHFGHGVSIMNARLLMLAFAILGLVAGCAMIWRAMS
jgi:hypothetical protein